MAVIEMEGPAPALASAAASPYDLMLQRVGHIIDTYKEDAPEILGGLAQRWEDSPELLKLLQRAVAAFQPPSKPGPLAAYHDRPSAFARDFVAWPEGRELTPYQAMALDGIVEHGRLAVRGPHTIGKSALASLAIWWFSLTRDAMAEDWKIVTTASVHLQLTAYLWPEIHKWHRLLKWEEMGRDPVEEGKELMLQGLRLRTGEAIKASPGKPERIEGAHADELMYVFDEAKIIPDDVWDATEGAFAGSGDATGQKAYALAISTPGEPGGRFYEIHKQRPGFEDWHPMRVTRAQAIESGRMSAEWADQRARAWGVDSAIYQNRVEGEFASSDEDGVIPLAWVEAAQIRWRERFGEAGDLAPVKMAANLALERVGVDCSGKGADKTVLARLYEGDVVAPLERPQKDPAAVTGEEEMATAGRIVAILRGHPKVRAIVDASGLGSGVVGRAREEVDDKARVEAFIAGAATERTDLLKEWKFADVRSAAWWHMREVLDPRNGREPCLPPDDMLTGDLCAPHYKEMSRGVIKVESKDTIRQRLNRSTDDGDAVVQAFWPGEGKRVGRIIV